MCISETSRTLNVGDSFTLTAGVLPAEANQGISWHSSDDDVVSVDCYGVVTALQGTGQQPVEIKAQSTFDNTKYATCAVTVINPNTPVTGISLGSSFYELKDMGSGSTVSISSTVFPANATNKTVIWSSSHPSIATVNSSGVVTKVSGGGYGDVIITATTQDGGYQASATVKVYKYTTTINNYFDNGFRARYNISTSTAQNNIFSYQSFCNDVFLKLFGLKVNNNVPTLYRSIIDQHYGHYSTTPPLSMLTVFHCDYCTSDIPLRQSIYNESSILRNQNTCATYWSGYDIETNYGAAHNNISSFEQNLVLLLTLLDEDSMTEYYLDPESSGYDENYEYESWHSAARAKIVLLHELSHNIGADDHYHRLDQNGICLSGSICSQCGSYPDQRPAWCIMNIASGLDIETRNIQDVFCPGCLNDITAHLNNHH